MIELLTWVSSRPHTYAEAMEAWGSHCPRLTTWEHALLAGLVRIVRPADGRGGSVVTLTAIGEAVVGGRKRQPTAVV